MSRAKGEPSGPGAAHPRDGVYQTSRSLRVGRCAWISRRAVANSGGGLGRMRTLKDKQRSQKRTP